MSKVKKPLSVDLVLKEGNEGYDVVLKCPAPIGMKAVQAQERQGGSGSTSTLTTQQQQALQSKKRNKAMAIATSPGKQILMNGFMMFMSGKSLNIFSISVTSMALMSPLKGLFTMNQQFAALEDGVDLQMPKLVFVLLNLVWFGVGLYKMSSMRLLPTTSADWTGSVVWKEMMESSSIPPTW